MSDFNNKNLDDFLELQGYIEDLRKFTLAFPGYKNLPKKFREPVEKIFEIAQRFR